MKIKELKYTDLKNALNEDTLNFKTTADLEPFNGIIGQERAITSLVSKGALPRSLNQ